MGNVLYVDAAWTSQVRNSGIKLQSVLMVSEAALVPDIVQRSMWQKQQTYDQINTHHTSVSLCVFQGLCLSTRSCAEV